VDEVDSSEQVVSELVVTAPAVVEKVVSGAEDAGG